MEYLWSSLLHPEMAPWLQHAKLFRTASVWTDSCYSLGMALLHVRWSKKRMIFFFPLPQCFTWCLISTLSMRSWPGLGSCKFKFCTYHTHIHSEDINSQSSQSFKAPFWCSYIRKPYPYLEITKNILVDKGLELDSLSEERSFSSLYKYFGKKYAHLDSFKNSS